VYIVPSLSHGRMITPRKSLGQNFLKDANIARNIVSAMQLRAHDVVVEIGPGLGALTRHMLEAGVRVIGIEVDPRAAELLRESFGSELEVLQRDVLSVDLATVAPTSVKRVRVVGNIPYSITSDILFWLYGQRDRVSDATVTMQREVAQRMLAQPGTKAYGILTVATQYYANASLLFRIPRTAFTPVPKVDSAVVRLDFTESLIPTDRELFTTIVRGTFGKRRKTLRNSLRYLGFSDSTLDALTFDLTTRPERLTLENFLELTTMLQAYKHELHPSRIAATP
jgi:16S rRNA (adenine1518-N6/adenine1519-N6)-dimethyltransferase